VKPPPFEYAAPESLDEALALLAERGSDAKLLAGGQSLVPLLNFRLASPALLIDLNRIPALAGVSVGPDGGLRLGAMTRQRWLERDPEVARRAPLLALTAPFIAHPQIRNRGTVGGSLAHADPAAELPAATVALDARLRLVRAGGERWVAARDFYVGLLTTDLAFDEMVAEVALPPPPPRTGWSFQEVARRHGDFAQVGVAAGVTLGEGGAVTAARLVYLSVGDVPVVAERATAALAGAAPSVEAIAAAAEIAGGEVDPTGDIHATADYKRHLARVLARRALTEAAARAAAGAGTAGGAP
jgi:CO/xanthine dehydrogenase FAD-binding subunit